MKTSPRRFIPLFVVVRIWRLSRVYPRNKLENKEYRVAVRSNNDTYQSNVHHAERKQEENNEI